MSPLEPDDPNDELLRRLGARSSRPRDIDRMWTRLRAATELQREAAHGARGSHLPQAVAALARGRSTLLARVLYAALAASILIVAVVGVPHFRSTSQPALSRQRVATRVYATGAGQTINVRLRDGTHVTLAPKSRLRIADDFGARERVVSIEGQGFFDVVHNDALPFRVEAKSATAEDIGTRFDVRAYPEEAGVVVIVGEGAVTIGRSRSERASRGAEGVIVRRGERARIAGPDSTITVDRVSLSVMGWTDGHLSFVRTPLAEIARAIGRWYDLDVRVPDSALQQRLITADFDTHAPSEMIEALATAVAGSATQQGRVLTIQAKR
jgi:transmembrane sensor